MDILNWNPLLETEAEEFDRCNTHFHFFWQALDEKIDTTLMTYSKYQASLV